MLNFRSTATRSQRRRPKSRLRRSTLPRPVYESSCWTSKEVYETSHSPFSRAENSSVSQILRVSEFMPPSFLGISDPRSRTRTSVDLIGSVAWFINRSRTSKLNRQTTGQFELHEILLETIMPNSHRRPDTTRRSCLCELSLETVW